MGTRPSIGVVKNTPMTSHSQGVDAELAAIMEGDLGEMLRHQLAASNPDFDKREINDALQAACDLAIRKDCHATSTGETYAWLRTTAHRWLGEQRRLRQREIAHDELVELVVAAMPVQQQDATCPCGEDR